MNTKVKKLTQELLQSAGIQVNGPNPWDIQIHNENFYERVLGQSSLGLGESYLEKWWSCQALDQFFERIFKSDLDTKVRSNWRLLFAVITAQLMNRQNKARASKAIEQHYDIGNDLFESMLDPRMNYSCAYWKNATDLEQAQQHKLELCCQKLKLESGMRVLDIGCGFGSFAKYAAENFAVEVVGVTISKNQFTYAKQNCHNLPIEIRLQDYRDVNQKFDRIISIGMFEHVGPKNYGVYFKKVFENLNENGLFLLHTIGNNKSETIGDEWLSKYIFPNGVLPSIAQIGKAAEKLFVMEDWHNFGTHYDKTLMAWYRNFTESWDALKGKYDECFYRIWTYYLLCCAASFRARHIQLWQIVFSKGHLSAGYEAPR